MSTPRRPAPKSMDTDITATSLAGEQVTAAGREKKVIGGTRSQRKASRGSIAGLVARCNR